MFNLKFYLKSYSSLIVLLIIFVLPSSSNAIQSTSSFAVSTSVVGTCNVRTTPVVFVGYDGLSEISSQGTIVVQCVKELSYQVALDAGLHINMGPDNGLRSIADGSGNFISYVLYKPDFSSQWGDAGYGDTYPLGLPVSGIGTGFEDVLVVPGFLPSQGITPPAGYYTDIVNVTVYF